MSFLLKIIVSSSEITDVEPQPEVFEPWLPFDISVSSDPQSAQNTSSGNLDSVTIQ